MRLFIAIHFTEEINNILKDAIFQLKSQTKSASTTRPENLHLTLAFIGETDRADAAIHAMDRAAGDSLEMTISKSGHFNDLWWVGTEKNDALTNLAERLKKELRSEGFDIERKKFKPHITIARRVKPVASHDAIHLNIPRASMKVSGISLMRSDRVDGRLVYTELYWKSLC